MKMTKPCLKVFIGSLKIKIENIAFANAQKKKNLELECPMVFGTRFRPRVKRKGKATIANNEPVERIS